MHKQKQVVIRELITRHQENNDRIQQIADVCETENRERTEAEDAEYERLVRDNSIIDMKLRAIQSPELPASVDHDTVLRENLAANHRVTVTLCRDLMTTADVDGTGIIPIQEQEMLKPLRAGLIYDKVGLSVRTGLSGGTLRWPKHGKAQAQWAAEGERLEDTQVDWSKLECKPERLGCAIEVTREELNDSHGIVESVVRSEMPASIIDLVNDALFTTESTYVDAKDKKTKNKAVVGPFVKAAASAVQFAGSVPTRKELLKMKKQLLTCGLNVVAPCWVMTPDMVVELEDTKVDTGSGRFLIENGMLLGWPVFMTTAIGNGNVGLGDWAYQAAGFFDSMNLIVDPYTLARKNAVDFVLNARFGTVTLYEEAFILGKAKAAAEA